MKILMTWKPDVALFSCHLITWWMNVYVCVYSGKDHCCILVGFEKNLRLFPKHIDVIVAKLLFYTNC